MGFTNFLKEKKSATGYELYHKDFSSAMQHAYAHAKSKGFVIDPKEIDDKVATGPKKPSSGKVNRYSLKAGRKKVEIQVTNLDNKRYELNMYIEEVELNEGGDQIWFKGIGMTFDEFSLIFATMYVPGSRVLPTEVAPDNSKYGSLLKKLSRKDQKWVVSLLKDYMKRGGVVHKDVVKNFVLKEEVVSEASKKADEKKLSKEVELVNKFGTPVEKKKMAEIQRDYDKMMSIGRIRMNQRARDAMVKKYSSKLKEEIEIDEAETPMYPPTIKNLRMIVKDKQNQVFMFKVGKARVDTFTASAIIAVYDGLKKSEHKKTLEDMIKTKEGFLKTQAFAMKMVK